MSSKGRPFEVDYDALAAEYERRYADYEYTGVERALLGFAHGAQRVLEVGCGTGHYLRVLGAQGHAPVGLDASGQMLLRARAGGARALVHGRAEALPFASGAFDRVCAINAFHHFADKPAFVREARRLLAPGGGLMIAGLDPHAGARWWIYDYYPGTRAVDCERYPASAELERLARASGFGRAGSRVVQHIQERGAARALLEQGKLAQHTTSQLALLSAAEYEAGIERLRRDIAGAEARGVTHEIEADLKLMATVAWVA